MKLIGVPPAQAEALFDAWEDDWSAEAPWRDDEADDLVTEPLQSAPAWSEPRRPALAVPSFGPAP